MKWLYSKFLAKSIDNQIRISVIIMTLTVFVLVLSLISISSFVLLNLSYTDVIIMYDEKEKEQLESVSVSSSTQYFTIMEHSKIAIQWTRNFFDNLNKKNDSFLAFNKTKLFSLVNEDKNSSIDDCNVKSFSRNCTVVYKKFDNSSKIELDKDKLIMSLSYPFLNMTLDYKIFEFQKQSIFHHFTYISNKTSTVYLFPNLKKLLNIYNESYLNQIQQKMKLYEKEYKEYNETEIFTKINLTNFYPLIMKNPIIINGETNKSFMTFSPKFKDENSDPPEMTDFLYGDWDFSGVNDFQIHSVDKFTGVKIISIKFDTNLTIGVNSCKYFVNLYRVINPNNPIIFPNETNINFTDCFIYKDAKQSIEKYIFNGKAYPEMNIKRKLIIPIINDINKKADNYYKFYEYLLPDFYIQSIMNSQFFTINKSYMYFLKSTKFLDQDNRQVFIMVINILIKILIVNLLLWILLIFVIIINVLKLGNQIRLKMNKIRKLINESSDGNIHNDDTEIINNEYYYIKEIDDLEENIKNLINGGILFNNYKETKNFYLINNSGNYYIKNNNIIIDEKKIEKSLKKESRSNILNYKREKLNQEYSFKTKGENVEEIKIAIVNKTNEVIIRQLDNLLRKGKPLSKNSNCENFSSSFLKDSNLFNYPEVFLIEKKNIGTFFLYDYYEKFESKLKIIN